MKYLPIILAFLLIGCTSSSDPPTRAKVTERSPAEILLQQTEDNSSSVNGLIYTEHFVYRNHAYINFVFDEDHSVVHDPECIYCAIQQLVEVIYNDSIE